ncbi:Protein FAM162A [Lemmus lemmus]
MYRSFLGHCFRLYERTISSSLRSTRNTELKRINGFCTKPQKSSKAPTQSYRHRVPLHKPTNFERKILLWSRCFKKEKEIPEIARFEMLDATKKKLQVKVSYLMIVLTLAGCIYMAIEGKKVRAGSTLSLHAFPKKSPQFSLRRERSKKKKPLCINLLTECVLHVMLF